MSRDEDVRIDLLLAARRVVEFVEGTDEQSFLDDPKTQSAVMHQLLVMGEAVKRLSEDFCSEHDEIPWRLIAGMRDRLIHHYDAVDLEQVWQTAVRDVPQLIELLGRRM